MQVTSATLGKDVVAVVAGHHCEPPIRPGLSNPLVPEDPPLFAVCGRADVVVVDRRLVRALPAVAHSGHLPLHPGKVGDVVGEVLALQLPTGEANGEDLCGAGSGVGSGENTPVCRAVYMRDYCKGDNGCTHSYCRIRFAHLLKCTLIRYNFILLEKTISMQSRR